MPFSVGDRAVVRALGNKGGEVIAVDRGGRYQVRLAGLTVWCEDADLALPVETRKSKKTSRAARSAPRDEAADPGRVDLHGLVVEEALARVIDEIDRSLRRGADRVEVVHGKGTGRVRDAVHHQLASMPLVVSFRLDPRNAGVTWAYFR